MTTHEHEFIDPDLLEEFFSDFSDAHQDCETTLIELENEPDDKELLNALFRSVHTIKGNLIYVGLKDVSPLIQSVEDVLDAIRNRTIGYDGTLSDVILLAMDKTKQLVQARIHKMTPPYSDSQLKDLSLQISKIAAVNDAKRTQAIEAAIVALDPSSPLAKQSPATPSQAAPITKPVANKEDKPKPPIEQLAPAQEKPATSARKTATIPRPQRSESEILAAYDVVLDDDLKFFQALVRPLEDRSLYWKGRTARLLELALALNKKAGEPVDAAQLAVAIYLHDIGMAFLPLELLHKKGAFNEEEKEALQSHPGIAYQLLSATRKWNQAAQIVLEHHERENGTGYPNQLSGDAICPGAKIVSLVDTFDARTHERAYSTGLKRPFVRAILEINRCSGSEFDPSWVDIFNEAAREVHAQQ